jgi:hypothetical protein
MMLFRIRFRTSAKFNKNFIKKIKQNPRIDENNNLILKE